MDFYIQASTILTKLDNKVGSIKGLTLHSGEKNGPRTYALILETLKCMFQYLRNDLIQSDLADRDVLRLVIEKSELLVKERKLAAQGHLPLVLVHDLLLNKGGIVANPGPFKDAVLRHKTRLQAEWVKAKIKLKVKDNAQLAKTDSTFIPRWARINTLKTSPAAMLESLAGFQIVKTLKDLQPNCIYQDEHIDNLLAFHPEAQLTTNKSYLDGSLIFQNKASCIPAAILNPPRGVGVIDACAAPGNKTSHLAAIMRNTGQLYAFERDTRRVAILRTMMQKAGAAVDVTHGDFTRTDPHDAKYANVTHLLLDPSCSGSGIVNRLDYLTDDKSTKDAIMAENETTSQDQERLESLSSFQLALLLHAMKFPAAQKITYSTCSVHAIENEGVVMEALRKSPGWKVARRQETLPTWPHRGQVEHCHGDVEIADGLVRAEPGEMGTIGFFVACFVRAVADVKRKAEESIFVSDSEDDRSTEQKASGTSSTSKRKKRKNKKRKKPSNSQSTDAVEMERRI